MAFAVCSNACSNKRATHAIALQQGSAARRAEWRAPLRLYKVQALCSFLRGTFNRAPQAIHCAKKRTLGLSEGAVRRALQQ
ncbi:hypothetical protein GCT13_37460 [Paraburkholderia sp. CNPSo 3157]|uniref:Uncharacterized protein n=1 Tax=Paraburkholderia franconis TaxID=2654983 RepID=A0A7X1NI02_9BURK|nr:hypothetical protein [Paraburkholderia franconis]MPW22368.1 hypothetical protein [Paraburkholderia franconis]